MPTSMDTSLMVELDRLFRDETGNYQIINYKTGEAQDLDTSRPEMELYSLLAHKLYPNQPTVTINLFLLSTVATNRYTSVQHNCRKFRDSGRKRITALQCGVYQKNTEHCCSCPYADPDGQCIMEA